LKEFLQKHNTEYMRQQAIMQIYNVWV